MGQGCPAIEGGGAMRYDYVIVGGGSAGSVLANRLSADPKNSVCLFEAGPDTRPEDVPKEVYENSFLPDYFQPIRYWTKLTAYVDPVGNKPESEVEATMAERRYEQARVMGGGSTVNGQIAIRGLPADYDEWESLGADGWSFEKVLPYFIRMERDMDFDGPYHGQDGPIPIRRTFPEHWSGFALAVRDALGARGIPYYDDCHAEFHDGCFPFTRNNVYNHRVSAAVGYLTEGVRRRPNLEVLPGSFVERILFEGRRATGLRVRREGRAQDIMAGEVIVSCGALHSPAMLMRNGIGPAEHLKDKGIEVLADLPGVGSDLQDHPLIGFGVHLRPHAQLADHVVNNFLLNMRWSSGYEGCTSQDMKLSVSARWAWSRMGKRLGTVQFGPNKAFSKGYVRLRSADMAEEPLVAFNLLSDVRDLDRMKDAVRFVHSLLSSSPASDMTYGFWPGIYADSVRNLTSVNRWNAIKTDIAAFLLDLGGPARKAVMRMAVDPRYKADEVMRDEKLMEEWIREGVQGDWHACCTCRMGRADDRMAVVDPHGRVHGLEGLRVVDASIMPSVPCANTNISTIMIGEKMSDHILAG